MDFDEVVDGIVEKAEKATTYRGVVAVARLEDKKLKVVCIPINQNAKFRNEKKLRKDNAGILNRDLLEKDYTFLAMDDVANTLAQLLYDINHHNDEVEEDCDDADLSLASEVASCGYVVDSCTAASVFVSPLNQKFANQLIKKMLK